jgi:hypothetical protein
VLLEDFVVLGDKGGVGVALGGTLGKARPDDLDEGVQFEMSGHEYSPGSLLRRGVLPPLAIGDNFNM